MTAKATVALPAGYEYRAYRRVKGPALDVEVYNAGRLVCVAEFRPLSPAYIFGPVTLTWPADYMLMGVNASDIWIDEEEALKWAIAAAEAFGGLPVTIHGFLESWSYDQGRLTKQAGSGYRTTK